MAKNRPRFSAILNGLCGRLLGVVRRRWFLTLLLFLPTLLSAYYLFAVAADQYESEASFVVRSAAKPELPGGLAALIQVGLARSQDDAFIVQDFLSSRDAVEKLEAKLPLATMYGREDADFLVRYPSFLFGRTKEEFYQYLTHAISVVHTEKKGISTLRVRAFQAADAQIVARTLLNLGEELVNRINRRIQTDAVSASLAELQASQRRLIDAQQAVTDFRNRELILDPSKNAVVLAELVARLSVELAANRARISEMLSGAAASPQLVSLQRKVAALEDQIALERKRIANDGDGLAARIATYERLGLEREFANSMLSAAEAELTKARAEAARQLLYLERISEPNLSDYSTQPKRLRSFATVFAANALLLLIGWLVFSGVREHASSR